jgi:hypothetical protein
MDMSQSQGYISEGLETLFFFLIIAIGACYFARSRGFFHLILRSNPIIKDQLKIHHVLSCFGIYLGYSIILMPIVSYLIRKTLSFFNFNTIAPIAILSALQLISMILIIATLALYGKKIAPTLMRKIWKDDLIPDATHPFYDWLIGALTWLIGFPVVAVIGQICDLIVYAFFGMQSYEQVAVRYLKMTLTSTPMLLIALFTILIAAPIVEEFLFRGLLQNWLKNKLGTKAAILIASFCFALFHLSSSQGIGNISLAVTLFCFACFLGFIYEKKASLFASIGLHMTFNAVSTFRILFFSDS